MMLFIKRALLFFLVIFCLLGLFLAIHLYSNVPVTTHEVIADDESEQTQRAADNFVDVITQTKTTYAARGAHAKGHACVKAWFRVDDAIASELRHGVFAEPGRAFKSWMRFSNGGSNMAKSEDFKKDSRGLAIKILEPGGEVAGSLTSPVLTQDFLMHNNPVFFPLMRRTTTSWLKAKTRYFHFSLVKIHSDGV